MDAVFRINYPPILGFEKFVGNKTTFEMVNHHHAQLIADPTFEHSVIPLGAKAFRAAPAKVRCWRQECAHLSARTIVVVRR